ncbi:MAG: sulfotransferase [Chloroflexi bacterium]|nr:sulfotransferase [Chloroflexota bacterium]
MTPPAFTCSMAVSASGHSLLALLLDAHPQLTHPGDTILSAHLFESANCACGKRHAECEFWARMTTWEGYVYLRDHLRRGPLKTLYSLPVLFPLQRAGLVVHPGLRRYARTLLAYPERVQELTGAQAVIYGRKRLADLLLPLATRATVRILHFTKHPIAQAISFSRRKARAGQTPADFAREWRFYNRRVLQAARLGPDTGYLHIRYEDLCLRPEETLTAVCAFLGVAFHPDMLRPGAQRPSHVIGARSLVGAPGQPFPGIRPPDLSFADLPSAEQEIVWRIAGGLAAGLGYPRAY